MFFCVFWRPYLWIEKNHIPFVTFFLLSIVLGMRWIFENSRVFFRNFLGRKGALGNFFVQYEQVSAPRSRVSVSFSYPYYKRYNERLNCSTYWTQLWAKGVFVLFLGPWPISPLPLPLNSLFNFHGACGSAHFGDLLIAFMNPFAFSCLFIYC